MKKPTPHRKKTHSNAPRAAALAKKRMRPLRSQQRALGQKEPNNERGKTSPKDLEVPPVSSNLLRAFEASLRESLKKKELSLLRRPESLVYRYQGDLDLLWDKYSRRRNQLGRLPLSTPRMTPPYLLGFHLTNLARTTGVLKRASNHKTWKAALKADCYQVADLGCGTGALSWAFADQLIQTGNATKKCRYDLIDRSGPFLKAARVGLESLTDPNVQIRTHRSQFGLSEFNQWSRKWLGDDQGQKFVLLGYVWNEVRKNPRESRAIIDFIRKCLDKKAIVVFLDPAEEGSAKSAMDLRNYLVSLEADILYPCPRSTECPMTQDGGRDWCYSEFDWSPPKFTDAVHEVLGVRRNRLGVSAYVFSSSAKDKNFAKDSLPEQIIVGHPQTSPNQTVTLTCNGTKISKQKPKPGLRGTRY